MSSQFQRKTAFTHDLSKSVTYNCEMNIFVVKTDVQYLTSRSYRHLCLCKLPIHMRVFLGQNRRLSLRNSLHRERWAGERCWGRQAGSVMCWLVSIIPWPANDSLQTAVDHFIRKRALTRIWCAKLLPSVKNRQYHRIRVDLGTTG